LSTIGLFRTLLNVVYIRSHTDEWRALLFILLSHNPRWAATMRYPNLVEYYTCHAQALTPYSTEYVAHVAI